MPTFRPLDRPEMEALLARNHVGRLAFSFHDRVDIEPIHYVYADGVLYARTSPGHKLTTLAHHRWVALEADEVDPTGGGPIPRCLRGPHLEAAWPAACQLRRAPMTAPSPEAHDPCD